MIIILMTMIMINTKIINIIKIIVVVVVMIIAKIMSCTLGFSECNHVGTPNTCLS